MKKFITLSIVFFATFSSFAQTHVNGYTRNNGTYVAPYYRSSPNYTKADNYSTLGNVNPYTGSVGTKTYSDYNNYGRSYTTSYNNTYSNSYSLPSYRTTYSAPAYNYTSSYSTPRYQTRTYTYHRY